MTSKVQRHGADHHHQIEHQDYYRNVLGNLSRTVTDERAQLISHACSINPDFHELDYSQKEDFLRDLYVGPEIINRYAHIKSIVVDPVFPRFKQKQGARSGKIFDPSLGHVKYHDEFSAPFTELIESVNAAHASMYFLTLKPLVRVYLLILFHFRIRQYAGFTFRSRWSYY